MGSDDVGPRNVVEHDSPTVWIDRVGVGHVSMSTAPVTPRQWHCVSVDGSDPGLGLGVGGEEYVDDLAQPSGRPRRSWVRRESL